MAKILLLILALALSACSTFEGVKQAEVGLDAEGALDKYGAPAKIQKVLNFEVWSYNSRDEVCQLYFQKSTLAEPAKCYDSQENLPSLGKGYSLLR